ncbi:MAG TPA: helix-turn-helix domain-containing protein [Flavobacteriaceae bacterium]|nr:helix-turn-helix domain-containing protein [Flavobacteriaceae bacterium]
MKHVSILVPQGRISVVNVAGTHQIFNQVNDFMQESGKQPLFDVQLVGLPKTNSKNNARLQSLFSVNPDTTIDQLFTTDLIIVPAVHENFEKNQEENAEFIPWIVSQHNSGAEVASFCIGAFFLAETGLLDGKQCSTHWVHAEEFKNRFPKVNMVPDKIMTAENGIYTSGGAYSYLNLLLYLIEKHAGREMAIMISKTFMIDIDKESQSPFIIFQGQKEHQDEPVKKAQDYIEENHQQKITVDRLAEMFALSRRSLERRFKKATNNTIVEYIQRVKMEVAKKSLESGLKNVGEVMFDVGYSDDKAFRNIFKKITGISPVQYRNRYNRELTASS